MTLRRAVWFGVGLGSVLMAVLGAALPLLPTTPFVLLAAFAFARSSERWHAWLLNHRLFGPMIENWRQHGAISPRAKFFGVIAMAVVFGLSLVMNAAPAVLAVQAVVLTAAAAFVLSRPSPPGH